MLFIFLMSILFIFFSHPLALGIILLFQSFFLIQQLGIMFKTFWFSYILFLVYIGGMLILFMYMISLIFNKKFNSINLILLLFSLFISTIIFFFKINYFNQEIYHINKMNFIENSIITFKLYNYPNNIINAFLISYLFFMMVVVVKITNFFYGPIRTKE